jgi:thymidylate synthase (FAD)
MRHRVGWSYNEESGRYRKLKPKFYLPARDRNLVQVGKPGAYAFEPGTDEQHARMVTNMMTAYEDAYGAYLEMLDAGIAREVARMVLPVGLFSSAYVTCNPRSLMAFLSLRTHRADAAFPSFPQREIEMAAEQMEETFSVLFPQTWKAFNDHGRVSP